MSVASTLTYLDAIATSGKSRNSCEISCGTFDVVRERKKQIFYITVLYGEEKMKRGLRLLISKMMIKEFWL